MKHQKIIDDLMKDFGTPTRHPMDFPSYRAAKEFRAAEIWRDSRERDTYGRLVMREDAITDALMFGTGITKTTERLAEDAKVREQVADIYRATIEKFFGLWEGSLVEVDNKAYRDWITSKLSPIPPVTWREIIIPPVPPPPLNYANALRWPGLYQ